MNILGYEVRQFSLAGASAFHSGRRHRQLRHTDAGSALDGVGDRGRRGDDRRFADAADAEGMRWDWELPR